MDPTPGPRRTERRAGILLLVSALALACLSPPASAQEPGLPAELQVTLLAKILSFDRQLPRHEPELVIGVVFQRDNPGSLAVSREIQRAFATSKLAAVNGIPVRIVPLPLDRGGLSPQSVQGINVLYLTPLRALDVASFLRPFADAGILTLTGVAEYVHAGAAVGVTLQEDRPRILIHLDSARRAGADFGAQLLRLAVVVP